MKTLVIGGLGFIGQKIVSILLKENNEVIVADRTGSQEVCNSIFKNVKFLNCDITQFDSLIFEGVEEVYNLAGLLGTSELETQIHDAVKVNILGSVNVFEAAIKYGVKKVFFPSKPNVWRNVYTVTKETVEELAKIYNKYYDIKICSLRLFNVYGEGQHLYPIRKIIPTFAIQAKNKIPLEIWGNGNQTVDLIYSDDIAKIIVDFTHQNSNSILDCGRGIAVSVNEIAQFVNNYFNNDKIIHLPMRRGEDVDTKLVANIEPLAELIDLKFSDFEESMNKTLKYYNDLPEDITNKALEFYKK